MTKTAVLTSKGQVTIPVEIRRKLGLSDGSRILFILENGSVKLVPEIEHPLKELKAIRKHVKFSSKELKSFLKASKRAWEQL